MSGERQRGGDRRSGGPARPGTSRGGGRGVPGRPERPARRDDRPEAAYPPLPKGVRDELERTAGRVLDARWFLGHALAALEAGDFAEALAQAERAKGVAARSPTVREALGVAAYASGDFKKAAAELQAYRRLSGASNRDLWIADAIRGTGRPMRAVEFLEETRASGANAARLRAAALADAGDEAGARAVLRIGGVDPDEPLKPVGSLRPGSVGSNADTRRRKSGTR